MKQNKINKIEKLFGTNNINITFDTAKRNLYINEINASTRVIKTLKYYNKLIDVLDAKNANDVLIELIDFCETTNKTFNSIEVNNKKRKENEDKKLKEKQEKEEEKQRRKEAKKPLQNVSDEILEDVHSKGYLLYDELFTGNDEWKNHLLYGKKTVDFGSYVVDVKTNTPCDVASNYEAYFEYSPKYSGRLIYDEYKRTQLIDNKIIDETTLRGFYSDIDNDLGLTGRCKVDDAYYRVSYNHKIHSLKNYLEGLLNKWDGVERLKTIFIDKMNACDKEYENYYKEISYRFFLGAVKRAFQPGCKNEIMPILVGCQGDGKNTLIERLFEKFGVELNVDISKEQEYGMKLDNCWCVLEDELARFSKKESSDYKKWLSIRVDNFRLPFEHKVLPHERHCCYIASTNKKEFLKDYTDTSERRYWPVLCHLTRAESWNMIDTLTNEWVEQIWAEAMYYYVQDTNVPIDIRGEYVDILEQFQSTFKTGNEDGIYEQLDDLLNRKYILNLDGSFDNSQDMINQMRGNSRDFDTKNHKISYINVIKSSEIKDILKKIIGDVREHNYFKYWLQDIKKEWYVNKQMAEYGTKCYVRIEPKYYENEQITSSEDDYSLPF